MRSLYFAAILAACAVSLYSCKKNNEASQNKAASPAFSVQEKKDLSQIQFTDNDVTLFIKMSPEITGIVRKYDAEIMKLPNKDDSAAIEKIKENAKSEMKSYLAGKNIDFDNYAAKSEKIIRVFMGEKIAAEPDLLETKRKQLEKIEKDPVKREEMLKAMEEAGKNIQKSYLKGASEEERSIIKKRLNELELLMKNQKIQSQG